MAWAVGGLTGLGAALLGGRGSAMAGACAAIALASIFLGKVLAVKLAIDSTFAGAPRESFESLARGAAAFSRVGSEKEYADFMVKYDFTGASKASEVTPVEIEFFKKERAPMLKQIHEEQLGFEAWKATPLGSEHLEALEAARERIENKTLVNVVIENLNAIDIIFALLGIMTAYRVGMGKPGGETEEPRTETGTEELPGTPPGCAMRSGFVRVPEQLIPRRQLLARASGAALAALIPRWLAGKDARKPSPYEKDVEFLVTELEKQAKDLLALKGIDWAAAGRQFREEAKRVKNEQEHVKLCTRLVARLRDGHATLSDLKVKPADESKGWRFTGPRVHLLVIDQKVYVRAAFGTAAARGIQVGMEVLKIDGVPARAWLEKRVEVLRDDHGYSTDQAALYAACHWGLADWEGTKINFELARGEKKKTVAITRQGGPNFAPLGPVFPPKGLKEIGRQSYGKTESDLGYIHLRDVPGDLAEQLDVMLEALGARSGLILDCRANGGGGCDHEAVFGRFLPQGEKWRQYAGAGKRPFAGPMVVIVDAGVRSAGETISGMLKEDGRAYMIGDTPTSGSSAQKVTLAVPSGLFAVYFSVASNKQRFNGGKGIEGIGVPPHEIVPYDPAELVQGADTQIRRAAELLKAGLPEDKVPYRPPG